MAALWQQQRPWATSCSAVRYAGPAPVPTLATAAPIAVAEAPAATTTTTRTAAVLVPSATVPLASLQAAERTNEVLSRQRWAAIGLVLAAALILLVLMLWVWLKDRCTSDGDCAGLCPRADVPCASRCNRGRCEQVPVSCTQPGQAWCPSRRACIDTRTEVCAAPGVLPVQPVVPPITPPITPPVTPPAVPPVTPPVVPHGMLGQQQQQVPLPLPAWSPSIGGAPHGGAGVPVSPVPAAPAQADDATAVALVPIMMHCQWQTGAGLQSVSVNGVVYVVDPNAGAVRLADDDGRLWECGSGGRWWHVGPLDGSRDPAAPHDVGGGGGVTTETVVACWDQTVDMVWTNDAQGHTWAAPRKGGADWSPCDPASGASPAGPPPAVPINMAAAAHDIARGRASVAAAASAVQGIGTPTSSDYYAMAAS
ncbi:hypothetical protein psal_cds_307 [Pandoravirus salinus]|uniref:Uncharacterized protein n=1 Tax=Pandoravirus salinus TaxID=1349410 RepID=S4VU87_9VIRU|nr:hypothetical protein psal_cds_307 [Pandoravirus salinus]AGO83913.1 hypothetical protein psal_cds_307 [Pandoravirus salinus]